MLVLSRKPGEKIYIDGNIEVTVIKLRGSKVSLGIKAPRDVKVLRGELFEDWASPEGNSQPLENGGTCVPVELTSPTKDQLSWAI